MTKLLIEGGNRLNGTLKIDSSKNALLPIIAAAVLVDGKVTLEQVPKISDIENMLHLLSGLGCRVQWNGGTVIIDSSNLSGSEINTETAQKIRGSLIVLGALLGRFKRARLPYPGGCAIGNRPIDLHLQGLRDLGVNVTERNGFIICSSGKRFTGGTVYLDYPSVGATENLILASVLSRTSVTIVNAAKEPEVADLCNFLNACGACIRGAGTSAVTINGVSRLRGTSYTAIPDRIITGSYLLAVASAGGDVTLTNTHPQHNESLITKLRKSGCTVDCYDDKIHIQSAQRPKALGSIQTSPYPGFPTDLQSQITVYQTISRGTSTITENLFESRFKYIPELVKLGAKITVRDRTAIVTGVESLHSGKTPVTAVFPGTDGGLTLNAADLRGGVALVIAALASSGRTVITNADYIYRGHQAIETDLASLGANIIRLDD